MVVVCDFGGVRWGAGGASQPHCIPGASSRSCWTDTPRQLRIAIAANDGATILEQMEVEHQIGKLLPPKHTLTYRLSQPNSACNSQ